MADVRWTDEQQRAISAGGGRVLVSAAAGSGKTAVLVERICRRITDPDCRADIDRFLIVTFTNAAAAGMKRKIISAIGKRLAEYPEDAHLARQLALCERANISTISSFCIRLVRQNFHALDLSPDFRIADRAELELLKKDVLERLLEEWYGGPEADAFAETASFFSKGKDDRRFTEVIERLAARCESMLDPAKHLHGQSDAYSRAAQERGFCSPWGAALLEQAKAQAEYACARVDELLADCPGDRYGEKVEAVLLEDREYLNALRAALDRAEWDEVRSCLRARAARPFPRRDGTWEDGRIAYYKAGRETIKDMVSELLPYFAWDEKGVQESFAAIAPPLSMLCRFTEAYLAALEAEKRERGLMDFADAEHYALRLLVTRDAQGNPVRTPLAEELADSFDEIYIDEYQDINELQDSIFRAVSREEKNIFLVGDVKQSIYRFRSSDPSIFLHKKKASRPFAAERADGEPVRVDLTRNFRSRAPVLDAVNDIFRTLMTEPFGEMDYAQEDELRCGADWYEGESMPVEIDFVKWYTGTDERRPEGAEKRTQSEEDAAFTARRIEQLLASRRLVTDEASGQLRPIEPRDIVILLRHQQEKAALYEEALRRRRIPVVSEAQEDFFAYEEVTEVLSLLQSIDNPLQDIPLIAAMRSGLFGFESSELAEMRAAHKDGPFYDAVCAAAARGEHKAAQFVKKLAEYRLIAKNIPVGDLLLRIYEDTDYELTVASLPDGAQRRENLRKLYDCARTYEASSYQGLFRFNAFIERVRAEKRDFGLFQALPEDTSAVRIMTIHKSKGLEFPVVFLCGCSERFSTQDQRAAYLFHPHLGIGVRRRDLARNLEYETLPRSVIRERIAAESRAEELRILYVAMTRAKEHLFVVGAVQVKKEGLSGLQRACWREDGALHPMFLRERTSYSEWLFAALQRHPAGAELRSLLDIGEEHLDYRAAGAIRVNLVEPEGFAVAHPVGEDETRPAEPEESCLDEISRRLDFVYPHAACAEIPAKIAVSDLKQDGGEPATFAVPEILGPERPATGKERGNALHHFMQFAELAGLCSAEGVEQEIARLGTLEFLTEREAGLVSRKRVLGFGRSALCARMLEAGRILREQRFNLAFSAEDFRAAGVQDAQYAGLPEKERVLVQGVIDAAFLERGAYVIVDFKTDALPPGEEERLIKRYSGQLRLYARAVEMMTGKPVREQILYSFSLGKEIKLP